jgi:hypothetical protein
MRRLPRRSPAEAGIDEFRAGILPGDKAAAIVELKAGGALVAMVGDGINDAPALAAADVSFAIGAGSDAAIEAADLTLIRSDLRGVDDAIDLSRGHLGQDSPKSFLRFHLQCTGNSTGRPGCSTRWQPKCRGSDGNEFGVGRFEFVATEALAA